MSPKYTVGFPEIVNLLWDGCALTSLSGNIDKWDKMENIYLVEDKLSLPFRATVGNQMVAVLRSTLYASILALIIIMCIATILNIVFFQKGKVFGLYGYRLLANIYILITSSCALYFYNNFTITTENVVPQQRVANTNNLDMFVDLIENSPELSQGKAYDEIIRGLTQSLNSSFPCRTNLDGSFNFIEDERGLVCRVYDNYECESIEKNESRPSVPSRVQATPRFQRKHLTSQPSDTFGAFLGEPVDVVLVERHDPRWSAK